MQSAQWTSLAFSYLRKAVEWHHITQTSWKITYIWVHENLTMPNNLTVWAHWSLFSKTLTSQPKHWIFLVKRKANFKTLYLKFPHFFYVSFFLVIIKSSGVDEYAWWAKEMCVYACLCICAWLGEGIIKLRRYYIADG